jgi:hypothetical protein
VNELRKVMPTVYHQLVVSVYFMYDPGSIFRQTSPDALSVEESSVNLYETWNFSYRSPQDYPLNNHT